MSSMGHPEASTKPRVPSPPSPSPSACLLSPSAQREDISLSCLLSLAQHPVRTFPLPASLLANWWLQATQLLARHYSLLTWSHSDKFLSLPSNFELSQEKQIGQTLPNRVGIYDKQLLFPEASASISPLRWLNRSSQPPSGCPPWSSPTAPIMVPLHKCFVRPRRYARHWNLGMQWWLVGGPCLQRV